MCIRDSVAAFDDRRAQPVFSGVLRGVKAAVARANHDDVKVETAVAHLRLAQLRGILPCQLPKPKLCCCRQRSNSSGAAATPTFRDSTAVLWGMVTR